MIELNTFVSAQGTECLNEDDEHPYSGCLHAGDESSNPVSVVLGIDIPWKVLSSSSLIVMSSWSLPLPSTNLSRSTRSGID